jgi:hypothetical protein
VYSEEKFASLEWFGNIVVGTQGETVHPSTVAGICRNDDEWDCSRALFGTDNREELWTSHVWHEVIGKNEVVVMRLGSELGESVCAIFTREYITVLLQKTNNVLTHVLSCIINIKRNNTREEKIHWVIIRDDDSGP